VNFAMTKRNLPQPQWSSDNIQVKK
jgi:hypothetical protein